MMVWCPDLVLEVFGLLQALAAGLSLRAPMIWPLLQSSRTRVCRLEPEPGGDPPKAEQSGATNGGKAAL